MNHPLPARPNFIPTSGIAVAGPSRPSSIPINPNPTSTAVPKPPSSKLKPAIDPAKCTICSSPPKYTCPKCSARSCSLLCSKTHKTRDECDGIRDPAAFVPLNQYGQGAWSDDYKWLEEGRRKVGAWGENVNVEEINSISSSSRGKSISTRGRGGRGGSRGDMISRGKTNRGSSKMIGLKRELERLGCDISFMPTGMEQRKLNQSSWSIKTKNLFLTIRLSIPAQLLDPSSSSSSSANKSIVHARVLLASPKSSSLPTLSDLISFPPDVSKVVCVLPFHSTPSRPAPEHDKGQRLFYPPLEPSLPLAKVLKGTAWVEFPTLEIMEQTKWEEGLNEGVFVMVPLSEPAIWSSERTRDSGWGKRGVNQIDTGLADVVVEGREEEAKKPKVAVEGLMALGEYESEDEAEEDDEGDDEEVDDVHRPDDSDEEQEVKEGDDDDIAEPSLEILRAVGMALAADLEEA
ncbi:uncharacterized protein IL334_000918 [Kwoniella shivajii]|uniref:HIT-type domain-containing protein n=1 Tax=Kwoniella shivajii TaxID=564305 RepID=A0ABZ1CQQ7_9TREE|nr:hypothetical protein IL334_000918 [Kwoniella shivajii]